MNFLFQYEKITKKAPCNRAYLQLLKKRSPQKLSFSHNQSKQLDTDKKEVQLENSKKSNRLTEKPNQLQIQRKVNSSLFGQQKKQAYNISFMRKHASSTEAFYSSKTKKTNFSETREIPVSFSSYIFKNKSIISSRKNVNSFKLKYFDLDEIANQIASPMKLQNKIKMEQQILKNHNFQNFLIEIQKDNTRYNSREKTKIHYKGIRTQQNHKKQILQIDRKSLWRKNLKINAKNPIQNIIPWTENQQQHSILRPKGRIRTKAIDYCQTEIFKLIQ